MENYATSRPVRARGLKHDPVALEGQVIHVAPRAGAWIETNVHRADLDTVIVAPRAGAWIETKKYGGCTELVCVAPRAGAWIETGICAYSCSMLARRAPCGRVD